MGYVVTWCDDAIVLLEEDYLEAARLTLVRTSNYYAANVVLRKAFDAALQMRRPPQATVFTIRAIQRGKELAEMMGLGSLQMDDRQNEVLFKFFEQYIVFITDTVYDNLDRRFYFPYLQAGHGECYSCYSRIEEFEHRFIDYAREQLQLLVNYFISSDLNGEEGQVISKTPDIFLRGMESIALATAEDLENSFWGERLDCSSIRLRKINRKLQQYNVGNRSRYPNDRMAVNFIHESLHKIILDIDEC